MHGHDASNSRPSSSREPAFSGDTLLPSNAKESLTSPGERSVTTAQWKAIYRTLLVISTLLILISLCGAAALFGGQHANDQFKEEQALHATQEQEQVAARKRIKYIEDARAYNRRLFLHPHTIGAVVDPFSHKQGSFKGSDDPEYNKLLSFPDGIMATLEIPRIHLRLAIRHGATPSVLEEGLGHLPGTSLPVGGNNTRAVITGHRGLVGATLFTRLPEVRPGDLFFVTVYGETFAYKVVNQQIVVPNDTKALTIIPGHDMVTLLTCTPYGINDHRLLVNGERTKWPLTHGAPVMWPSISDVVMVTLLLMLLLWLAIFVFRHRDPIGHHILQTIIKPFATRRKVYRWLLRTEQGRKAAQVKPGIPPKYRSFEEQLRKKMKGDDSSYGTV